MKKRIEFTVEADKYLLSQTEPAADIKFQINKGTLAFDTKSFYEAFFLGLAEKPEVEVYCSDESALDKTAAFIYKELADLATNICKGIKPKWFVKNKKDDADGIN
jgi:hypothetical protein